MRGTSILLAATVAGLLGAGAPLESQAPTGSASPESAIRLLWSPYLDWRRGSGGGGATPSPYWLSSEQQRWRSYDLAYSYLPDNATFDVLTIEPDKGGAGEYRIVTRFTSADENNPMRSRTVDLTTFAVRSGAGWVLANALPRLTRDWLTTRVGPIEFVIQPGCTFDSVRAKRAATFVDSLAHALDVPVPEMSYYVTLSVDDVYRIIGLETPKKWGAVGGVAQPINGLVFSGIPTLGENYRHELAHVVIMPLIGNTTYFVSEGVPTWFGGTSGMDLRAAEQSLSDFLRLHPSVTLDSIIGRPFPVEQFYPAGAVFVAMAFERGGTSALKALFNTGSTVGEFQQSMERLFGMPWRSIAADWRARAVERAGGHKPVETGKPRPAM